MEFNELLEKNNIKLNSYFKKIIWSGVESNYNKLLNQIIFSEKKWNSYKSDFEEAWTTPFPTLEELFQLKFSNVREAEHAIDIACESLKNMKKLFSELNENVRKTWFLDISEQAQKYNVKLVIIRDGYYSFDPLIEEEFYKRLDLKGSNFLAESTLGIHWIAFDPNVGIVNFSHKWAITAKNSTVLYKF